MDIRFGTASNSYRAAVSGTAKVVRAWWVQRLGRMGVVGQVLQVLLGAFIAAIIGPPTVWVMFHVFRWWFNLWAL